MAKKFLEDMIQVKKQLDVKVEKEKPVISGLPDKKQNENSIPPKTEKKISKSSSQDYLKNSKAYFDKDGYREVVEPATTNNSYFLWFLVILIVVFSFFSISAKWSTANITISPKIEKFSLENSLLAKKDLSQIENDLSYQLIIVDDTQTKIVEAKGEKEVKEKAKGEIVLYNAFSTSPQKLNIDTRLIGSNNKIYKTAQAITIPGMTGSNFGSVTVEIYAEKEGEEYNSEPLDFQIFGFKGTSKFDKIYGRSKGPITGGFLGNQKIVDEETYKQGSEELKNSLEIRLLEKALDQIPNEYILFRDATFYKIDSKVTNNSSSVNEAEISAYGTLYGFLFNKKNLETYLLENKFADKKDNYYISNLKDLVFEIKDENLEVDKVTEIEFNLKGEINAPHKVNENNIIQSLAGKSKKEFTNILSSFESVNEANLSIKPIWQTKIPKEIKKIKLKVNYP